MKIKLLLFAMALLCSNLSQAQTTPTVSASGPSTLCSGNSLNLSATSSDGSATFSWSGPNGFSASGASVSIGNAGVIASGTYYVTATANSLTSNPDSVVVTVNQTPDVYAVTSPTVCNGSNAPSISFNSSTSGSITYNWTNDNTSIGLAANNSGNISSFQALNTGNTNAIANITVTPVANGCTGASQTFTYTIYPTPTVDATSGQTLCTSDNASAITFTGSAVANTTYNWTNNNTSIGLSANGTNNISSFSATNTGSSTIYATITVVPVANGCSGLAQSFSYAVYPTPTVSAVTNQTICSGLTTSAIGFTGTVSGTSFIWTNDNSAIGLPSNGIDDITPFTATNATSAAISGNFVVTPTANGCLGAQQTFVFTVNPTPVVNTLSNQTVCNGNSVSSVSFTGSSIPGTSYNWTNDANSIGLSANGSGDISSFTASNSSSSIVTANITVTPSTSSCTGTPQAFSIIVNPTPTATLPSNQAVCNGSATTDIVFTGAVSGTVYNWTNDNTVTGLAASGTGSIGAFSTTNGSSSPISSTITVTPTANGCSGVPQTLSISVNPIPSVSSVSDQILCSGNSFAQTSFGGSPVSGTTYNWANSNTAIGLAASGTNSINTFNTVNTSGAPLNSTITVTPVANGCTGASQTFNVVVNPTPDVTAVSNQTVCNGTSTTAVNFSSSVGTTVFNWTNNTTSIGLANAGTGNISGFTATNATSSQIAANVTVTPVAYGCTGSSQNFSIYVNPTLVAAVSIASPSGSTVCAGANTTFNASATNGGASPSYQWLLNGSSTGFGGSSFSASNFNTGDVVSCVMISNAPCTSTASSNQVTLTVNPVPNVDPISSQEVCNGTSIAAVSFTGSVSGTTFNWTNNQQSTGIAATGSGNIASANVSNTSPDQVVSIITVTPVAAGCTGSSQSFNIAVDPSVNPSVSISANTGTTICPGANVTFTAVGTNKGSAPTYQWLKNGNNVGAGGSTYTDNNLNNNDVISCTMTSNANCLINNTATSNSNTITLYTQPSISAQPTTTTICGGNSSSFSVSGSGSGVSYQWQVNNGSGFANVSNGGVYSGATTNTLSISNASGSMNGYQYQCVVSGTCSPAITSTNAYLNVNTAPGITYQPSSSTICPGANTNFSVTATGSSLSYQWMVNTGSGYTAVSNGGMYSGANSGTLTITGATAAMNNYQYECAISGICSPAITTSAATLYLNSAPAVVTQPANVAGCDAGNATFTVNASGTGINGYQWLINTGSGFVNLNDGATYSGSTTNSLAITGLTTSMNGYQYKCIISGTCTPSTISNAAILNVGTAPSIVSEPSGNLVCPGDVTTFTTTATGSNLNYQWFVNTGSGFTPVSNSSVYSGATSGSLVINGAQASMNGYQYQCQISGNCTPAVVSSNATLSLNAVPAISAQTGNNVVCENSNATFSVTATGTALNYQWQVNTGTGFANIYDGTNYIGTNTSSLTVASVTPNMSGYSYQCIVSGTCTPAITSNASELTVNILPSMSTQASSSIICAGSNTSYTVTATGTGITYQWQANSGSGYANINDGGVYNGTNTNTLNISNASTSMDGNTYRCIVSGACTPFATSADVLLTINDVPAIATQPVNSVTCNGSNASFVASATGAGVTYQWQVSTGNGFTNISNSSLYSGVNFGTLYITGAPSTMNNYQYRCLVSGVCSPSVTTNAATLTFNASPASTATAGGPTTFCQGSSVTLSSNTGTGYSYQWLLNGNPIFGATTSSILATDGGSYTVAVTNGLGCTTTSSAVVVTTNATPSAPVNVLMGTLSFCAGGSVVLGTNTGSGLSYQWKNNGVDIAGQTNVTYTATTPGNYSVVVSSANCTSTSSAANVVVNPMPSGTLVSNNPPVICSANGSLLISANAVSGQTYQWYDNGLAITGANGDQISATTGGVYTVKITSAAGCITFSQSVTAIYSVTPAPVITQSGNTLSADPGFASYQWYYNGNPISGANSSSYNPTQNGTFTVMATNSDGCSGLSAQFSLVNLGVQTSGTNNVAIKIYPNPVTSVLHIDASESVNVSVSDMQGKVVIKQNDAKTIDMSQIPNGIYILQVFNNNQELISTERLVKNAW